MKRFPVIVFILLTFPASGREMFPFLRRTVVIEDSLNAARMNGTSDDYTAGLSPFDLAIRLHSDSQPGESDYLNAAARNMRDWKRDERQALIAAFLALEEQATALRLQLRLPDTILVCSTRGREEFGAEGYTRGNRIMLHVNTEDLTPGLLAHELWHVISRHNRGLRDSAYACFGFRPCNRVDYKSAFGGLIISNPDCPYIEHYIRVESGGTTEDLALVLYARSPYVKGGGLMDYAAVVLLALQGDEHHKTPLLRAGRPVVRDLAGNDDFYRQTGRNTGYMLHVEELTAEHFAALMTGRKLREPGFVERLAGVLR